VILSRILQLFHRNDHHIGKTCHAQHLGRYLESQGHSMTLQQNRVWPITLLFQVGFYNYFIEMITIIIEMTCHAQHLGCFYTLNFVCDITLTLQEVYLQVSKTYSGSITGFNRLLFCNISTPNINNNGQVQNFSETVFMYIQFRFNK
jgi:hypothetical protein